MTEKFNIILSINQMPTALYKDIEDADVDDLLNGLNEALPKEGYNVTNFDIKTRQIEADAPNMHVHYYAEKVA